MSRNCIGINVIITCGVLVGYLDIILQWGTSLEPMTHVGSSERPPSVWYAMRHGTVRDDMVVVRNKGWADSGCGRCGRACVRSPMVVRLIGWLRHLRYSSMPLDMGNICSGSYDLEKTQDRESGDKEPVMWSIRSYGAACDSRMTTRGYQVNGTFQGCGQIQMLPA